MGPTNGRIFIHGPIGESTDESFWPVTSQLQKEDDPSIALRRSHRLMDSLYDMRRMKRDPEDLATVDEENQGEDEENEEVCFLDKLLTDLEDTSEQLRVTQAVLQRRLDRAKELRGSRHPTACQCARNLACTRRKADMVRDCEERAVEYEEMNVKRDEIFEKLSAGTQTEVPYALVGIKKFVKKYTHKGDGPHQESRLDFHSFATHFKLSFAHQALVHLEELGEEAGEWWAAKCLERSENGASYEELQRLLTACLDCGADEDHPKIVRAIFMVRERLALNVLEKAQKRLATDKLL